MLSKKNCRTGISAECGIYRAALLPAARQRSGEYRPAAAVGRLCVARGIHGQCYLEEKQLTLKNTAKHRRVDENAATHNAGVLTCVKLSAFSHSADMFMVRSR